MAGGRRGRSAPQDNDDAARSERRRRLAKTVGVFAAGVAIFYAITALPWFDERFFPAYLHVNAEVAAWILGLLGEDASVRDTMILSSRFALEVRRGCDAVEPSALLAAAMIAFPVGVRRSLIGLAVGIPSLLLLNIVRIVSLYYVGVVAPRAFDTVHVDVWQPVFILAAMLIWLAWAIWATPRRQRPAEPRRP